MNQQFATIRNRAKAQIDRRKAETDLKLKALRQQAETAMEGVKTRIQRRIADTEAEFEMRQKKLFQARDRAVEFTLRPD